MSQELKDRIGSRWSSTIGGQINAMSGVDDLAATSILTYEENFILKGVSEPTTYLYLYKDKYGIMVNYTPSENDIIGAFGSFVLSEYFSEVITADDLTLLLEQFGITNVEISLAD